MAYSHGGSVQWGTDGKWAEAENGYWIAKTNIHNEKYGLAIKLDRRKDNYYIFAKPLDASVQDKNLHYETITREYDKKGDVIKTRTVDNALNRFPSFTDFNSFDTGDGYYLSYKTVDIRIGGIPIFDNDEALQKYLDTGDDSGALKELNTNWTLGIDGTKSPLYKLKWNCAQISENDIARVRIGYGGYDDISGKVSIHKWQLVDYSPSHFNTNYAQINNAVWGEVANIVSPLATLATVYIAVQLEYYSTPTVLPTGYSSIMYCELFKNQKNGHMYGDIGFLEKDENGLYDKVTSGDGSTFTVKDGEDGSKIVTSDDDDGYSDDKDDDENDNDTSDVSSGIGVLTTTFKMTKDRLKQLGRFLWGSNIFDNFSLICNNPIENIISCKSIPLSLDGSTQKIILGNVDTGVNGDNVSNNFAKQNIGSIAITEKYHNFLDYAPYTNVIIYLPYVGFKELDTNLVMGKTLSIYYTVDIITGGCLCQITSNKVKLYEFNGNMGIDIPITASNRAQVEAGYISSGIGIASSAASGNIVGAVTSLINSAEAQYHYASTSSPNPMCVASTNRTCYVILDRPTYQTLKSFNHTRGKKCYLTKTINTLKGYTICDEHIDLSGIRATDSEKEELVKILSSGFFVN